jgi:hypothetical protein
VPHTTTANMSPTQPAVCVQTPTPHYSTPTGVTSKCYCRTPWKHPTVTQSPLTCHTCNTATCDAPTQRHDSLLETNAETAGLPTHTHQVGSNPLQVPLMHTLDVRPTVTQSPQHWTAYASHSQTQTLQSSWTNCTVSLLNNAHQMVHMYCTSADCHATAMFTSQRCSPKRK